MALNIKNDSGGFKQKKPDMMNLVYGKIPPQSIEMEQAVIGACMLEREAFEVAFDVVKSDMFYMDAHQKIFKAMEGLQLAQMPIDLLTITEQLRKQNELEIVGGAYFLTTLTMAVTSAAHVATHARYIAEKHFSRELIRICSEGLSKAYNDESDIFELITETDKGIQAITEGASLSNFVPVGETYTELLFEIEERKNEKQGLSGVNTGYYDLNSITDGWQPSNLILLAARPSQGKTALALNFAINADCDVLIYSLEANKKELVKRLAAMKTGVFFSAVKKGALSELQQKLMEQNVMFFNQSGIKIDDKTQHLDRMISGIRREKKKNPKIKLVIVDYIQLIRGARDKNGNREQEVASISRELKLIASELELSIIALSQLNREVEKTVTRRPTLANLRESGALEQDANIVLMIWHKPISETETESYVIIEKNRDGELGDIKLNFSGEFQRWHEQPIETPAPRFDNPRAGFQTNTNNFPYVEDEPF